MINNRFKSAFLALSLVFCGMVMEVNGAYQATQTLTQAELGGMKGPSMIVSGNFFSSAVNGFAVVNTDGSGQNSLVILKDDGTGTFSAYGTPIQLTTAGNGTNAFVAAGKFTGDVLGDDIAVLLAFQRTLTVYKNDGSGNFSSGSSYDLTNISGRLTGYPVGLSQGSFYTSESPYMPVPTLLVACSNGEINAYSSSGSSTFSPVCTIDSGQTNSTNLFTGKFSNYFGNGSDSIALLYAANNQAKILTFYGPSGTIGSVPATATLSTGVFPTNGISGNFLQLSWTGAKDLAIVNGGNNGGANTISLYQLLTFEVTYGYPTSFSSPVNYPVGNLPYGLSIASLYPPALLNNIVVTNQSSSNLTYLTNEGSGLFTTETISSNNATPASLSGPMSIAIINKSNENSILGVANFTNNTVTIFTNPFVPPTAP